MSNRFSTDTSEQHYWFKRKYYGWGWTPVTVEGWLAVGVFVLGLVLPAILMGDRLEENGWWLVAWFGWMLVMIASLLIVTARHAPPGQWRWGRSGSDNPDEDF